MIRYALLLVFAAAAARAETISVKDVGPVDLSGFDCTPVTESKLLRQVCYDKARRYMVVQIGDGFYDNCRVTPREADGLIEAGNVVAFYNTRIRARHKCTAAQHERVKAAISQQPPVSH